jgi:excisionase family DNA binding protein
MFRKKKEPVGELLSASQAARVLGVTRQQVYLLLRQGKLPKVEIGGFLLVPRDAVERYASSERKPGPKPKKFWSPAS